MNNGEGELLQELALFIGQVKVKRHNCAQIGQFKNCANNNGENKVIHVVAICYYYKSGHDKNYCFTLKRKIAQNNHPNKYNGNSNRQNN
jgi:hypothetical protein